jgi:hypothetical protein
MFNRNIFIWMEYEFAVSYEIMFESKLYAPF